MRTTTFIERHLFNCTFFSRHVFYVKWKRVGREQTSRERERNRERDRLLLRKGYGVGNKGLEKG